MATVAGGTGTTIAAVDAGTGGAIITGGREPSMPGKPAGEGSGATTLGMG